MRTVLPLTGFGLLALAPAGAQTTEWFQTCDRQTIVVRDDSCRNLPLGITDNCYHRVFDLADAQTAANAR